MSFYYKGDIKTSLAFDLYKSENIVETRHDTTQ